MTGKPHSPLGRRRKPFWIFPSSVKPVRCIWRRHPSTVNTLMMGVRWRRSCRRAVLTKISRFASGWRTGRAFAQCVCIT
ncbi:hypothetical protein KCP70_05350 [Salmonella enterica subsp. enterica]|nr:hypothetical protein KCP70_05350 [Salmonella enterica subsp. enterica]